MGIGEGNQVKIPEDTGSMEKKEIRVILGEIEGTVGKRVLDRVVGVFEEKWGNQENQWMVAWVEAGQETAVGYQKVAPVEAIRWQIVDLAAVEGNQLSLQQLYRHLLRLKEYPALVGLEQAERLDLLDEQGIQDIRG